MYRILYLFLAFGREVIVRTESRKLIPTINVIGRGMRRLLQSGGGEGEKARSKKEEVGCRERSNIGTVQRRLGQERFGRLAVRIASGCMHRGGVGRGRRGSRSALTYCSTFVHRAHSSLFELRGVEEEEEEEGEEEEEEEEDADRGGR